MFQKVICFDSPVRGSVMVEVIVDFTDGSFYWKCSIKKVFLKISQNSNENT